MVHVAKADDVAELAQLHPVEDAAAHITRTLVGEQPTAQHGDGLLARLEFLHEKPVLVVAQQVAADGRRVQVGDVEFDEGVVDLFGTGVVDAFGFGALESGVDLATGQVQAADRAVAGQLLPGGGFENVLAYGGRFLRVAGLVLDQFQRYSHLVGGAHDHLVDHHRRDGRPRDGIHGDGIRVAGVADDHPLADLDVLVFGTEGMKFCFGNPDQQDRFVVLQDIGVLDHPRRVEDHLGVDRLARIGRNIHHIQALEHVTGDGAGR
ncbi:hypothetical protein D3C86_1450600 [compost metagenome]